MFLLLDAGNLDAGVLLAVANLAVAVRFGLVADDGDLRTLLKAEVGGGNGGTVDVGHTDRGRLAVVGEEDLLEGHLVALLILAQKLDVEDVAHGNRVLLATRLDDGEVGFLLFGGLFLSHMSRHSTRRDRVLQQDL